MAKRSKLQATGTALLAPAPRPPSRPHAATSKIYLGAPLALEQTHESKLGCELSRLHVAGQRASWAIMLGARTGLDLEREAERLLAETRSRQGLRVLAEESVTEHGGVSEMAKHPMLKTESDRGSTDSKA